MPTETPRDRLVRRVKTQAEACGQLGSPLYRDLLERVADDVLAAGPALEVLRGHELDPGPSALALRLMGGVHRLVLEGRAPALAPYYPSVGGRPDAEAAWPRLRDVLAEHRDELRDRLAFPPQTNEVGRAAALIGGLLHILAQCPGPVRLFEMGASAGLNLRADRYRLPLPGGGAIGPPTSPVVLSGAWAGVAPPLPTGGDVVLDVVQRGGCDTEPLDPTTGEGRLRLMSYVWPDQLARIERLRGALDVAASVPAHVERSRAADFVGRLELRPDTTTVLWHSVMWQYLEADEQAGIGRMLAELGGQADARSRFAHLRLEPVRRGPGREHEFLVVLRVWPGDDERVLGTAHPHGLPTTWEQ